MRGYIHFTDSKILADIYGYLHIHTIPAYSDIPTHTCDTYTYRRYLYRDIVTYLRIPSIPTDTSNTY